MEYHQTTLKQNHCSVNSLEQHLILIELRNLKKLAIDLISMIKKIIQERKQLRELLNISVKCPCNGRANKKKSGTGKL